MSSQSRANNPKNKLAQLLCRHKHTGWYTKPTPFFHLKGETRYLICEDCGKQIREAFIRFDY